MFMSKVYQKSLSVSSPFFQIYSSIFEHISPLSKSFPLPMIKFLPIFTLALLHKESIIYDDLASFIAPLSLIQFNSAKMNINRFLSNLNFDFSSFWEIFITLILSSYKLKHPDKKVYITFDHCFVENRFTIFMFTLRLGNSSVPLWFKTFPYKQKDAFSLDTLKDGILFCHNLLKSIDPDCNICFLADRFWAEHYKIFDFISSLYDRFDIRTKSNVITLTYDLKEAHHIYKTISNLKSYVFHSNFFFDIPLSRKHYKFNLAISKSDSHKEPFYIVTNGNPKYSIKNYSKRFSSIEFLFKAQKSNGFFLEETQIKDCYTFNSLYVCICIAQTFATILGIDYSKNRNCYKGYKINATSNANKKRKRDISYFRIGLILFTHAIIAGDPFNIFKRLILYDV